MKIGLFYGSTTCYTAMAAEKIQTEMGAEQVELHDIKDTPLAETAAYDVLIFGISTWDYGELQEDWEAIWPQLTTLDLQGKIVAMYGMGDQLGYGLVIISQSLQFGKKRIIIVHRIERDRV